MRNAAGRIKKSGVCTCYCSVHTMLAVIVGMVCFVFVPDVLSQSRYAEPVETQDAARPAVSQFGNESSLAGSSAVDVQADHLDYDRVSGIIEARGGVMISQGNQVLRADHVRYHVNSGIATASGNVVMVRGNEVWSGERLSYDFNTRRGDFDELRYSADPYHVRAMSSSRDGEKIVLHRASITTCRYDHPHEHYHIRSRKLTLVPGERLVGRGSTWYFGRVPVLYLPYWRRNLSADFGWRFYPGQSSRMGFFLLSSYRYRFNPAVTARTHLDYRSRRGVALGQDVLWRTDNSRGGVMAYYLDDKRPLRDGDDPVRTNIDNDRYRITLEESWRMSERNMLRVQANYLSDTRILADFFEREFRSSSTPDNYVSLSRRGQLYTADVTFRGRLNDFYGGVNRLPEASLRMMRQPIAYTPLFYEGFASASNLERVFPVWQADVDDYSAFRFDTGHTIYYPQQYFGFLNVIPRGGFRGTYYDDSKLWVTETTVTTSFQTNIITDVDGIETAVVETITDVSQSRDWRTGGGQVFRSMPEMGVEVSYRAFKMWMTDVAPWRHVAEPYLNWTYVPEPNVVPEELLEFDRIDRLDKRHDIRLGMRNKWQTKRNDRSVDVVDLNTYTDYRIERDDGEDAIDRFFAEVEIVPAPRVSIFADAIYSLSDSEISRFNARVLRRKAGFWRMSGEYRYRANDSSLLAGNLTLYPVEAFDLNVYARYEFEDSRFEEYGGYFQRNLDCMHVQLSTSVLPGYTRSDGRVVDDDWRIMVAFWLSAFPDVGFRTRYRD